MLVLSVGREDAGRVIEPRKKVIVEMADSVSLLGKATSSRTIWEGLDDISGVVGTGHVSKVYIGIVRDPSGSLTEGQSINRQA